MRQSSRITAIIAGIIVIISIMITMVKVNTVFLENNNTCNELGGTMLITAYNGAQCLDIKKIDIHAK